MKHLQSINEFLSSPYNWEWTIQRANMWVAKFVSVNDKFTVEISKEGPFEDWELKFSSNARGFAGTFYQGPGDAMKVLTTVFMDIMVSFLELNPDATIKFWGSQGDHDHGVKGGKTIINKEQTKRDRVYKMLMDQLPDEFEWNLKSDGRTIEVRNKHAVVQENKSDDAEVKPTRYLLHITKVNSRKFVEENGIIPRKPSEEWMKRWADMADDGFGEVFVDEPTMLWTKSAAFFTLFKDSDKTNLAEIRKHLFPIAWMEEDVELNFDQFVDKNNLDPGPNATKGMTPVGRDGFWEDWNNKVNPMYNTYLLENAKFDVWIVDTKDLKNKFYEDLDGFDDYGSIYTTEPIPPSSIKLILKDNKTLV